jgi:hypothetical protein
MMLRFERNEYGYPIFEAAGPDFDRRRIGELLDRLLRQRVHRVTAEEPASDWEGLWIDLGGEG